MTYTWVEIYEIWCEENMTIAALASYCGITYAEAERIVKIGLKGED